MLKVSKIQFEDQDKSYQEEFAKLNEKVSAVDTFKIELKQHVDRLKRDTDSIQKFETKIENKIMSELVKANQRLHGSHLENEALSLEFKGSSSVQNDEIMDKLNDKIDQTEFTTHLGRKVNKTDFDHHF